jgi:hypothetical protein
MTGTDLRSRIRAKIPRDEFVIQDIIKSLPEDNAEYIESAVKRMAREGDAITNTTRNRYATIEVARALYPNKYRKSADSTLSKKQRSDGPNQSGTKEKARWGAVLRASTVPMSSLNESPEQSESVPSDSPVGPPKWSDIPSLEALSGLRDDLTVTREKACCLSIVMISVASQVRQSDLDEWKSVEDMVRATLNNVLHDYGEIMGNAGRYIHLGRGSGS